jgi:hypothetical protein
MQSHRVGASLGFVVVHRRSSIEEIGSYRHGLKTFCEPSSMLDSLESVQRLLIALDGRLLELITAATKS